MSSKIILLAFLIKFCFHWIMDSRPIPSNSCYKIIVFYLTDLEYAIYLRQPFLNNFELFVKTAVHIQGTQSN